MSLVLDVPQIPGYCPPEFWLIGIEVTPDTGWFLAGFIASWFFPFGVPVGVLAWRWIE